MRGISDDLTRSFECMFPAPTHQAQRHPPGLLDGGVGRVNVVLEESLQCRERHDDLRRVDEVRPRVHDGDAAALDDLRRELLVAAPDHPHQHLRERAEVAASIPSMS